MRPCGAVEELGTIAEANLMISTQQGRHSAGYPPQACRSWALHSLPNSRKVQNMYIQLWANFLKVSQEIKMRSLTNSNLERKETDHNVYWRFSVFLRFTNIFKRSSIESHETLC